MITVLCRSHSRSEVTMNRLSTALLLLACCFLQATAQETLSPHLKPLAPFLGKTWRGVFKESKPENPMHDVARWERALNGQAVRILHSVNDGIYGGETIVVWDSTKQSLVFSYFTTAGFYTNGTAHVEEGSLVTHEYVNGNANGITEVKGTSTILPDGSMKSHAIFLQNRNWVEGHEILYHEDEAAKVIFK
jgi:hypothetical protein